MPPKYTKKQAEARDVEVEREEREQSMSSEGTLGPESVASNITVTSDHLERILQANQRSMAALIAALPTASAPSLPSTRSTQIKTPKWSDEETPCEYFNKFEKAMRHNGVNQCEWGHLLPVYLSGRAQASFAQVDEDTLDTTQ